MIVCWLLLIITSHLTPTICKYRICKTLLESGWEGWQGACNVSEKSITEVLQNWHTGIPGLWTQVLDAGLWTLDSGSWDLNSAPWTLDPGRYTLVTGLWRLDSVIVCFRRESEPSFWFCLIILLKILWVRISKNLMVRLVLQKL